MNYTFIILGIIVAVLIYVLYLYFSDDSTKLFEYQDLQKSAVDVKEKDIGTKESYAYGFWIYVNNYSGEKTLLQRGADGSPSLKVYLPGSTPTLMVNIPTSDPPTSSPPSPGTPNEEIAVTNNFPIQKWVHVVVSKEGKIVDVYIDGKLVKSHMLANSGNSPSGDLKSSDFPAFMARLKIWKHALNPQTVYDEYMKGNGQSGMITGYGVDVSVLRDNIEQTKFSLL